MTTPFEKYEKFSEQHASIFKEQGVLEAKALDYMYEVLKVVWGCFNAKIDCFWFDGADPDYDEIGKFDYSGEYISYITDNQCSKNEDNVGLGFDCEIPTKYLRMTLDEVRKDVLAEVKKFQKEEKARKQKQKQQRDKRKKAKEEAIKSAKKKLSEEERKALGL